MEFLNNIPIYQQIVDLFKLKITSGELLSGEKLQPVREVALALGVNPNTVQKSFAVLEQENLVYTERTTGRFVTTDTEIIRRLREKMLIKEIESFLANMKAMGYDTPTVLKMIMEFTNESKKEGF